MTEKRSRSVKSGLEESEQQEVLHRQRIRAAVIYQTVRSEGLEELRRPNAALWWSGIAAGFAASLAVYVTGLLHLYLPDTDWRPLVQSFGYTTGFLLIVYGRLHFFTEDTLTPVLPLMANYSHRHLLRMFTLWGIVLLANLTGTMFVAVLSVFAEPGTSAEMAAVTEVAVKGLDKPLLLAFLHAIPAGFLVAVLVWLLPSAHGQEFIVVIPLSYIIGLGGLSHVVIDSSKAFVALFAGEVGVGDIAGFLSASLAGNIIGGTVIFALLAYGQVRREIAED